MKRLGNRREEHGTFRRGGNRRSITIDGTVYPADWNELGQVTAFDLVTGDDQVLRILNSEKFFDYEEAYIEAQGIMAHEHRAGKSILIKRFQVVQH